MGCRVPSPHRSGGRRGVCGRSVSGPLDLTARPVHSHPRAGRVTGLPRSRSFPQGLRSAPRRAGVPQTPRKQVDAAHRAALSRKRVFQVCKTRGPRTRTQGELRAVPPGAWAPGGGPGGLGAWGGAWAPGGAGAGLGASPWRPARGLAAFSPAPLGGPCALRSRRALRQVK